MPFGDHVFELLLKEGNVVVTGLMRAPLKGVHDLLTSPGRRGELDRRAAVLVEFEQTAGRVVNICQ